MEVYDPQLRKEGQGTDREACWAIRTRQSLTGVERNIWFMQKPVTRAQKGELWGPLGQRMMDSPRAHPGFLQTPPWGRAGAELSVYMG